MSKPWQYVRLGEVLTLDLDRVVIDVASKYPMVGVYSFGRGLFDREPIENGKTSYKFFYRLKASHFVMSQLFGWEGALALSSPSFAGKFVSPQFPTFLCDETKLDRQYLGWAIRRPIFWEDLGARASGMGDRRRTLTPEALFACQIPLPPLSEQRRIVARIEELAAKINEARGLRQQTVKKANRMVESRADKMFSAIEQTVPLGARLFELIYRYPTFYNITFTEEGVGLLKISNLTQEEWKLQFHAPRDFIPPDISARFPRTVLEPGDLVIAARGATIGKTAYVTPEFAGFNINPNLLRLKPDASRLNGKYFWYFMRCNIGQRQFQELVTSTAKQTITVPKLKSILVPLPSVTEQRRIVAELDDLQTGVDGLKKLQAETAAELDALIPSILDKTFKGEL